ncbi:DNA modification methylase [Candidatus Dojkabacteria bacterium]|uniref:DNA modification methylase n=1 Tax=Candidatus Dojkabacteria bacterium TaxID=2099670 RepID=A0A955IDU6_9BACT|nr:DNA modification methylase [Candidatus Dojkabacteria bacterium]
MKDKLQTVYVKISDLKSADYNPRKWDEKQLKDLKTSIKKFGIVDPAIVNSAENRKNIVIGGHMRIEAAKALGIKEMPIVYLDIPELEKEKELNLRLNKNQGEFDFTLLTNFAEEFLSDIGFNSEELDLIFDMEIDNPEIFDLKKELDKLDIKKVEIQKGDIWRLGNNRLMCGDSTINRDVMKLMDGEKADMCFTDPPYLLDYLKGKKKHGKPVEGFGAKRNRKYLETDVLPDNFTEEWMGNIAKIAKDNFHIIVYENWKNIRTIWGEMEKYWKVKNMIVWHLPNRNQGFAAKYKFFSKHDIAMVGSSEAIEQLNIKKEEDLLQNEYETAIFATAGKPHWESYKKGKKIQPTDFIEYKASDEKSSGQGIIFGTKPTEILIPYIKVLTKRDDLIIEPFGGSGSTLIAATKMKRRCNIMEKSPVYSEVIKKRWEKYTGEKGVRIS